MEDTKQDISVFVDRSETNYFSLNNKLKKWWCRQEDISEDPRKYSNIKKGVIIFIIAVASGISPVSSSIYYPAVVDMQKYFNTSDTMLNASLSIFTFFTAFFPLVWATFGDLYGRKRIYLISFFITCIGNICCAVSVNIEMFIVFRAFSAIGTCSAMALGAGTIADIYEPRERGRAFAYYTCGPLLGPLLGPTIGGILNEKLGWRSNFYFLSILCFSTWVAILIGLPETWRSSVQTNRNENIIRSQNSNTTFNQDTEVIEEYTEKKTKMINPIGALKLLLYPNVALCITFIGILFFTLYLNTTNFTRTYTLVYGFSSSLVGICYLPSAIGCVIGGMIGGRTSDKRYNKRIAIAKQNDQEIYPEMRLGGPIFYFGIIFQLFGFIAYGWCVEEKVHFAYGLACQFVIGVAIMLPNIVLNTYLVDCFHNRGASVTACNNFVRYVMAGIGTLVASDILRALGNGILFTLCGCAVLLFSGTLIVVIRKGRKWKREKL